MGVLKYILTFFGQRKLVNCFGLFWNDKQIYTLQTDRYILTVNAVIRFLGIARVRKLPYFSVLRHTKAHHNFINVASYWASRSTVPYYSVIQRTTAPQHITANRSVLLWNRSSVCMGAHRSFCKGGKPRKLAKIPYFSPCPRRKPKLLRLFRRVWLDSVMGARRGGHLPPPPGIWKNTSYAAVLQNTLILSLAPLALALDTLYFSLKRREKRKSFRLRLRRA